MANYGLISDTFVAGTINARLVYFNVYYYEILQKLINKRNNIVCKYNVNSCTMGVKCILSHFLTIQWNILLLQLILGFAFNRYTFGKAVKGKGTLTLFSSYSQQRKYILMFEVMVYFHYFFANFIIFIKYFIKLEYICQGKIIWFKGERQGEIAKSSTK